MAREPNLVGKRFGSLVVESMNRRDERRAYWWNCVCDCGGTRVVRTDKLVHGSVTCCGKCKPRYKDMTGKKFGKLTVVRYAGPNHRKDATWLCKCDCGNEVVVQGQALRSGATVSCGCYNRESHRTHGGSGERLYGVWHGMRNRCNNHSDKSFKHYGALGVKVCPEWDKDYSAFREWALASGYDPDAPFQECTIDRIDPSGDYEPSNCRWVDIATQERNKRKWQRSRP